MSDVYRSAAGRDAVTRWCEHALAGWPVAHRRLHLDIVPETGTLADDGAAPSLARSTAPVASHVVEVGDPASGPLAVLVPDAAACAATLGAAAAAFAAHGPVWVVDVPGRPGGSAPESPRHDSGVWAAAWLDGVVSAAVAAGARDVVLVGHSAGALPVLGARSGAVRGRVLVAPAGIVRFRAGARMARDTARWLMRATPATSTALARRLVGAAREPEPEVVDWLTTVGGACRSRPAPRPLPAFVVDRALAEPSVVLVGDDDCYLPAAPLAAAVSRRSAASHESHERHERAAAGVDAEGAVTVLDGCGHVLGPQHWERVAARARDLVPAAAVR